MSAGPTCGGVGFSVNNGSTDPDGDAINCVQSAASFEMGTTQGDADVHGLQGLSSSAPAR